MLRGSICYCAGWKLRPAASDCIDDRISKRRWMHAALASAPFESHLKMFDLGMPPHGGLAIGLERLTCQVLGLKNIREAALYPRDLNRLEP